MDLIDLKLLAGLSDDQAARYCGISLRTWHHYRNDPPLWLVRLLSYRAGFLLGWPGFRLAGSVIYTPINEPVHKNQVEAFWWLLRLKTDGLHEAHPDLVQAVYRRTGAIRRDG